MDVTNIGTQYDLMELLKAEQMPLAKKGLEMDS